MSDKTGIQWTDGTVNPVMGCSAPCELRPAPAKVHRETKSFLIQRFPDAGRAEINDLVEAQTHGHDSSQIFQLRVEIIDTAIDAFAGKEFSKPERRDLHRRFKSEILDTLFICYAHQLHLMRGTDITKPYKETNPGYAERFEILTKYPGRMADAAYTSDLYGKIREEKPWLNYLPRVFFVSDMADALSKEIDFEYLREEIIESVRSSYGQRHIWLWLTKRPKRMAEFGGWLRTEHGIEWPDNLVAMTSVTSKQTIFRASDLQKVPCRFRGLSVEPLWENVELPLDGIDWCIVGGESGANPKEFDLAWAENLQKQCKVAKVAFFVKQMGSNPVENGKTLKLENEHGGDWSEWPEKLRIREMPTGFRSLRRQKQDMGMPVSGTPA